MRRGNRGWCSPRTVFPSSTRLLAARRRIGGRCERPGGSRSSSGEQRRWRGWSLGDLESLPVGCEECCEFPDWGLPAVRGVFPGEVAVVELRGAGLVSGQDGEAVGEVGGALERGGIDPRPAPLVVEEERERRAGVPEPAGGLGDDAGGVGLVVADE